MTKQPSAIQVVIYDMGSNPLPDKLVKEVQQFADRLVKDSPTLAQAVVTE